MVVEVIEGGSAADFKHSNPQSWWFDSKGLDYLFFSDLTAVLLRQFEYENGTFKLLQTLKGNQNGEVTWITPQNVDSHRTLEGKVQLISNQHVVFVSTARWCNWRNDSLFQSHCPQRHVAGDWLCYLISFSCIVELEAFK